MRLCVPPAAARASGAHTPPACRGRALTLLLSGGRVQRSSQFIPPLLTHSNQLARCACASLGRQLLLGLGGMQRAALRLQALLLVLRFDRNRRVRALRVGRGDLRVAQDVEILLVDLEVLKVLVVGVLDAALLLEVLLADLLNSLPVK